MLLKKNIPIKYIFGKVKYEIIFVAIYASAIGIWDKYYNDFNISIPLSVPMVLGTVLSLLLAFKSNQAYDRWWEARIVWGAIVNDSRTLVRQLLSFMADPYVSVNVKQFQDKFTNRQIAWCYSLGQALRNKPAMEGLNKFLSPEELAFVSRHDNVPNALLQLHGRDLKLLLEDGQINRYQQVEMEDTLTRLCDSMGKCERIKNTVFPVTYSLYIHFSLFIFVLLLPFALLDSFGILEIPMVITIALSFFLIEKMAIHLQDPFENKPTDTPVTAIARTIERNLRQMINDSKVPEKLQPSGYFVL
ncbi:bestrophin family protein [Pontibacter sp. 13R65]|uniref:bestrophin family protein n=1 Tax=Pontibacter sp. 13R65 TaxID=3127458 RepID=UPI00301D68F4